MSCIYPETLGIPCKRVGKVAFERAKRKPLFSALQLSMVRALCISLETSSALLAGRDVSWSLACQPADPYPKKKFGPVIWKSFPPWGEAAGELAASLELFKNQPDEAAMNLIWCCNPAEVQEAIGLEASESPSCCQPFTIL